jgi:uncharacterized membrane protein
MATLFHLAVALALLATALMAGLFYAFSISVMPGLGRAGEVHATRAMQAINLAILRPVFFVPFLGALLFPLAAAAAGLAAYPWPVGTLALAGGVIYGIGVLGVTFEFNVPLNQTLAAAKPGAEAWRHYARPWTGWNHVRTICAILAFALMVAALLAS